MDNDIKVVQPIQPDDVFEHIESGAHCIVVAAGLMKVENSQWYESVTYRNPTGVNPDMMFTRCAVAFREKFRKVEGS